MHRSSSLIRNAHPPKAAWQDAPLSALWRGVLILPGRLIYKANGSNAKTMAPTCAESSEVGCGRMPRALPFEDAHSDGMERGYLPPLNPTGVPRS
jgi:hypothetical protein